MRTWSFKILPLLLLIFVLFLQYRLWFEHGGIQDMLRAKKQLAAQIAENDRLKLRNQKLLKEVKYLHSSKDAMEARARNELGMVKKGETFYQVVQ